MRLREVKCMMRSGPCLILFAAALLSASGPSWNDKDISQWTLEDARQVLRASPWVRRAEVNTLPSRSEAQMRDAGRMGTTKGAGFGALDASIFTGLGEGKRLVPKPATRQTFVVRWESAALVRQAELKTGDTHAPDWEGKYYALAVYGVPGLEDQRTLPLALKKSAFLRQLGHKDLKPQRVELLFDGDRATVLYLFPRSSGISAADKHVWFVAQIGSLFVEQSFDPGEMQFQGKLEL
jgi:hypothetical protein